MKLTQIKSQIENILKPYPPLFRLGSKVYHKLNGAFRTLSPGTPQAIGDAMRHKRKLTQSESIGDYYEFGLFRGYTFLQAYKHSEKLGLTKMKFFGFDSFQGLPPPADDVDAHGSRFFEGQFACSKTEVESNLNDNGMPTERMSLIEGFYEDTLNEKTRGSYAFGRAAVVLFDCDYYSSTKDALDWIQPKLQHHTVLLFDDWYSYGDNQELGQQRALSEFLDQNPGFDVQPLWKFLNHGKAFTLIDTHIN